VGFEPTVSAGERPKTARPLGPSCVCVCVCVYIYIIVTEMSTRGIS
jgi:hypothetical protein